MNLDQPIETLAREALAHVAELPRQRQINLYRALEALIPKQQDKDDCGSIAFTLEEAEKQQCEFCASFLKPHLNEKSPRA